MAVLPGTRLFRLGSLAPSALLVIASIKVFDAQRNPTYTPVIKEALQTELDLPADRSVSNRSCLGEGYLCVEQNIYMDMYTHIKCTKRYEFVYRAEE